MARKRALKRPNGTGSVYQRHDGRWVATALIDGVRVHRYRRSRAEAELALAALVTGEDTRVTRHQHHGPRTNDAAQTLHDWAERWLVACHGQRRASTCHAYRKALDRILPAIGTIRLRDLTPVMLADALANAAQPGSRAMQECYTVLRTCLEAAVSLEVIPSNPMTKIAKPQWQPPDRDYWTLDEVRRFIDHALTSQYRWSALCVVLVTTGLRLSEAFGLTWGDVDLARSTVRIRETVVHVDNRWVTGPPKTKSGSRVVSLDAVATAALSRIPPSLPTAGVFRTSGGLPPTPSNVRQTLLRLCAEASVRPIHPHGLRHVSAMLALRATRDIYLVQRRLGHANVTTTLGIYGYTGDAEATVATALDGLLGLTPVEDRRRDG